MTPTEARIWITKASLLAYGCAFVFFVLAPALGYPLAYSDAINTLKIVVPVFSGYLGAAALSIGTVGVAEVDETSSKMLALLVKWPVAIFGAGMAALLIAFPVSNRSEFSGAGMTPNVLSLLVSILIALLTATTGAISSFLFKVERAAAKQPTRGLQGGGRTAGHSKNSGT